MCPARPIQSTLPIRTATQTFLSFFLFIGISIITHAVRVTGHDRQNRKKLNLPFESSLVIQSLTW